ncbi:hypothetical protein AAVH_21393 [Aphelenchoides avenae]|nr:hypothetical protein AAVH_21393 [Aphelenchus avenae]
MYPPLNATAKSSLPKPIRMYAYFEDAGFLPLVVVLIAVKAIIAIFGIVMNAGLAWITYRNSAVYELSFLITFGVVVSGKNVIPFMTCVYLQLIPTYCKYFTLCLMVFIGLDRLKSILMPTDVAVCTSSEISKWYAQKWTFTSAVVLNVSSASIYLVIFILLRTSKAAKNLESTARVYKSLCIIVTIEVVGWGSNSLMQLLSMLGLLYEHYDEYTVWCVEQVLSYLLVMATTVDAPVLFLHSEHYRKAFLAELNALRRHGKAKHGVVHLVQKNAFG